MNSIGTDRPRNFRVIINDQRDGALRGQNAKIRGHGFDLRGALFLASKLQDVYAAIYHFTGHPDRFVWSDVDQVKNAVEPAAWKSCQNYWSKRVGGELNSKFPEFITRSTNPVS